MTSNFLYASFLIRLWRLTSQQENGAPETLRSEVEHIQSGQTWKFSSFEQLMDFLKQQSEKEGEVAWIEMQLSEPSGFQMD